MTTETDVTSDLPSDDDLRDEIVNYDIWDAGSQNSIVGNPKLSMPTKATALHPNDRTSIYAELDKVHPDMREQKEAEMVAKKVEELAHASLMRSGPGDNATPYQKAVWSINREAEDMRREMVGIAAQLDEVGHIDPVTREETRAIAPGTPKHAALVARHDNLLHAIGLKLGSEGQKRLDAAFKETADLKRQVILEQREVAEAERRATRMVSEARINRRAEAKARFMTPTGI